MASNIITSDGKDLDERYLPKGTSIPPHSKAHLVDSWRSGANWWRKWSDGFIEQGGKYSKSSNNSTNVQFNVPMSTVCSVTIGSTKQNRNAGYGGMHIYSYSSSGFYTMTNTAEITGAFWYACGY